MRSWFVTDDAPTLRETSKGDPTAFEVVRLSDYNLQIGFVKKELAEARAIIEEQNHIIELLENQRDDAITREWMEHEYENARLTYDAELAALEGER